MSDIKAILKEAREALKNKDAAAAQRHCKIILDQDADHYMALVLMGASLQESDPSKAASFLRRAVKLPNNNLTVALQGLSLCAEAKEMPDICRQLLVLVPDRYEDLFGKLYKAAKDIRQLAADVEPFVSILRAEVERPDPVAERCNAARYQLAKLYVTNSGCAANASWQPIFLDALQHACRNPCAAAAEKWSPNKETTVHAVMFKAYLKLLYTKGAARHVELLQGACEMFTLFPGESYALECICNVFVVQPDGFDAEQYLALPIAEYASKLCTMSPQSAAGLLASAICAYRNGQFVQARDLLKAVHSIQSDWDVCARWLARTYRELGAWPIAEAMLRKQPNSELLLAECLVAELEEVKAAEAIELSRTLMPGAKAEEEQIRIQLVLAKGLIASAQYSLAEDTATSLSDLGQPQLASLVRALACIHQNDSASGLQHLLSSTPQESVADSCAHLIALSRCHYNLKQWPQALSSALAATKLAPFNSECFHLLGDIYLHGSDDTVRATKCYSKCLLLNERHCRATRSLVALHAAQNEHATIEALLNRTVADPLPGLVVPCAWVWLLVAQNRLRAGRFNDAVTGFRCALRENPTDLLCWLGLADTYHQRGSLNSAMKVYQKCLELRDSRLEPITAAELEEYSYAKLQVASLKSALGQHLEAVADFGELLVERGECAWTLKGLADTHMSLALEYGEQKLWGRARQHAAEVVATMTRALRLCPNFAILWRLLSTGLAFIASMATVHSHLAVSAELTGAAIEQPPVTLRGPELFALAAKCIARALKIRPDDQLLWYDMALINYQRALKTPAGAVRRQHLERASAAARYTIQLNAGRWQNWNLLGVICVTAEANNAALAAHCFIRAVQLCRVAAPAWTNLGVLYAVRAGDVRLANRAFSQAQQAQTDYVHSWTGQACLAEQLGQSAEAIDLFQHATGLQYSAESALGFVHWICATLSSTDRVEPHMRYVCDRMFGSTAAVDSIEWYLRAEDAIGVSTWCFAGYLYYGRSMWPQAVRAFQSAVELAGEQTAVRDKMLFNLGVSLLRDKRAEEAQRAFHAVEEATFDTAIGLAVAHQQAEQFEEAYGVYQSALEVLAQTDAQRSQVLVAMSAIVYQFQGEQDAKSLLFQCIGQPEAPVAGLFSGCAVGIIHGDMQLSELVLNELQKWQHDERYIHHVAFLTAQFHLRCKRPAKARLHLLSQVHMHPAHLELRTVLANFILQNGSRRSEAQLVSASRVAESTIVLRLAANVRAIDSSEQGAKALALASEAMRCVDQNRRRLLAQRAVHVNPTCRQAWAALLLCAP